MFEMGFHYSNILSLEFLLLKHHCPLPYMLRLFYSCVLYKRSYLYLPDPINLLSIVI